MTNKSGKVNSKKRAIFSRNIGTESAIRGICLLVVDSIVTNNHSPQIKLVNDF